MTDRKKVIKGVHDTRKYLEDREWVDKSVVVHIDALNDALELLKEQEAVEPNVAFTRVNGTKAFSCPRCSALIYGGSYCSHCGQALKGGNSVQQCTLMDQ